MLARLEHAKRVIFSNGSFDMLSPLLDNTKLRDLFTNIISVDQRESRISLSWTRYAFSRMKCSLCLQMVGTLQVQNVLPIEEIGIKPDYTFRDLNGILELT